MSRASLALVQQPRTEQEQAHNRELVLSSCATNAGTFELVAVAQNGKAEGVQIQSARVQGNVLLGVTAGVETDLQFRFIPLSVQESTGDKRAAKIWHISRSIVPDQGATHVFWSSFDEALHVPRDLTVADIFTLVTWAKLGEKGSVSDGLSGGLATSTTTAWRRRLKRLVGAQGRKAFVYGGGLLPETVRMVRRSRPRLIADLEKVVGSYSSAFDELRSIAPSLELALKKAYKDKLRLALKVYLPTIVYRYVVETRAQGRNNASGQFRDFVERLSPIFTQVFQDMHGEGVEFEFSHKLEEQWQNLFAQAHGDGDKKQFWNTLNFFTQSILEGLGLLGVEQVSSDSLPVAV